MSLGTEVGLGPGDIVRWGTSLPLQKGGSTAAPDLSAHVLWPNGLMDQDATWYGGMPRPWSYYVRSRPRPPHPQKKKGGGQPQFSAHVCCGQTVEWIQMPLGTEVGLGPGDIVLDGDPAPP